MKKHRIILFVIVLYILAIGNIFSPIRNYSDNENRILKQLPEISRNSIFSGRFGEEFEEFASDQFIFRDKWIGLKTRSDLALQKKDNGRVFFGRDGYLFAVEEEIDKDRLNMNIKSINVFLDKLKEKNLIANFVLIPSKSTVFFDKLPIFAPVLDENIIVNILKENLSGNSNLIELSKMLQEKRDSSVYYRTDHHWTTEGAFYSYEYVMNKLNKTPLNREDYFIETVSENFLGSNYRMLNFYRREPDKIEMYTPINNVDIEMIINRSEIRNTLYDKSFLKTTDKYSFFLGGDNALIQIRTSVKNDKKVLIVKDSFANSFVPFLVSHYEDITMIDTRFFNESIIEFIEDNKFDEILFIMNVENYYKERTLFRLGI